MSQNVVLSCPNCATRFSAPVEQFLPNGRQVRCSQCKHVWFHAAPRRDRADAPGGPSNAAPVHPAGAVALPHETTDVGNVSTVPPDDAMPPSSPAQRNGFLSGLLWLTALALLMAILAYVFRDPLRSAVPQSAPWLDRYADTIDNTAQGLIGRTVAHDPLRFKNIHYDVNEYDGEKEILVEADLVNTGTRDMPAPQVRVRVVDADRAALHASVIGPEDMSESIPAGTSTRYFVRIPQAPSNFEAVLLNIEED